MAGRKKADPLAELAEGVAADHALAKAKGEAADTVAAGAIEGAGAVAANGGDADQTAAGAIGGAAAATAEMQAEASAPVDTTATDTPPEVEDDEDETDTAFERRLDRLSKIVEEAEFEAGTAVGDIRDCLLELFKTRDKPWHLLDANQRKDLDTHFTKIGQMFVRKVVQCVAEEDFETLQGTLLDNFSVKGDALEVKLKLSHVDPEVLLAAYKLAGKQVVVINASDHKYGGARRPNHPGETQVEIPFADPPAVVDKAPAPAEHPSDDSDLAGEQPLKKPSFGDGTIGNPAEGGGTAESSEDLDAEAQDPEAADWIVYDAEGEVWLAAASEDDPWTDVADKAMRFTLQEAKDECESHGEGMIVQRSPLADKVEGDAAE